MTHFGRLRLSLWTCASFIIVLSVATTAGSSVEEEPQPETFVRMASDARKEEAVEESSESSGRDELDDGVFDPLSPDPSCNLDGAQDDECWNPPESTLEEEEVLMDVTCSYGGDDPSQLEEEKECVLGEPRLIKVDKHWGSDQNILNMRDKLRHGALLGKRIKEEPHENRRPPVFLMPGLASTRLVSWKFKACDHALLSDVKVQDYVWLNINMLLQMGTINPECWVDCVTLGLNQTDMDDEDRGCKLRPDEGLDAISSLAPGSIGSNLLVGGTNTVYAWLIQWLADNLGYDVSSIVGLPYDWRLSPNVMEKRDGFLTLTKLRIEAAVKTNGQPGIMVAHSMGNVVFRYFLEWLRQGMREEAYQKLVQKAERRAKAQQAMAMDETIPPGSSNKESSMLPGWMGGVLDDLWHTYFPEEATDSDSAASREQHYEATSEQGRHHMQLWELAQMEGDNNYIEWLETHIWSYVGLSAPLLGAVNPLRAVISGENMGLPISDEIARVMELSFGSTHNCNPISSKMGFCDQWDTDDWAEEEKENLQENRARLGCLDDIMNDIENHFQGDPWENFPQLKILLKSRVDWDTDFPMISIVEEQCTKSEKPPCASRSTVKLGPRDAQSGELFSDFSRVWKEKDAPLVTKREQLEEAYWKTRVPNILNTTWDRPHIKHVIMAYGVDVPTEVGYVYRKTEEINDGDSGTSKEEKDHDGIPSIDTVIWEEANGILMEESVGSKGAKSMAGTLMKKKAKKRPLNGGDGNGTHLHSGDGTIAYLSLSWAHTWLLHAARATLYSEGQLIKGDKNPLDAIKVSHRPKGGSEWVKGGPKATEESETKRDDDDDTGTTHPHGTKYKPTMVRFHSDGKSRTTGMEYSTTVIEAIGVEHKETTRNYDILAAVFTDVLDHMHEDFGLI